MPGARIFVDSATFLYTLDEFEGSKRNASRGWLRELALSKRGVTNLQVLNEITSVLTRKTVRFPNIDVFASVDVFAEMGSTPLNWSNVLHARAIRRQTSYSWWDSLLLASALELGCTHFLSEDLQDGRQVDGLTIVDPFAHSPRDVLPA